MKNIRKMLEDVG